MDQQIIQDKNGRKTLRAQVSDSADCIGSTAQTATKLHDQLV